MITSRFISFYYSIPLSPKYAIIVPDMQNNKDIKLLAILGMSGSGKSSVVDYLTKRGVPKIYFGGMIYKEMEKRGIEITPETQGEFREMIRNTEGDDWVGRQVVTEAKDLISAGQKRIVLDGLYSWAEYKLFKHEFPGMLTSIAVVIPKSLRYERLARRPERPFSAAEIRDRDLSEIERLQKGAPIAMADYYILNDGSLDDLYTHLKAILSEIGF